MRFHLIDRIEEIHYNKYITGVKCITLADDVFNEHFPGYPIFPGSLIMEGMAQLAGSFLEIIMQDKKLPQKQSVLTIVNKLKFKKPAYPGDKILYRADLVTMRDDYGVANVTGHIDNNLCASGELTFSFIEINDQKLFDSRKELYNICMKNTREIRDETDI